MMDHYAPAPISVTGSFMCDAAEAVITPFCRKTKFVNLTKMLVCLLVIVSLLLTMVVPVHAIALTTGIAIATVGALVLAACGVVLTAPTGQSLTDYIGSQIDSFAVSQGYSNRTTWLSGVTQQTVTSTSIWSILDGAVKIPGGIYNALTTWAGSYIEDNNVVSNGQPVGQVGSSSLVDVKVSVYGGVSSPDVYGWGTSDTITFVSNESQVGVDWITNTAGSGLLKSFVVDTSKISGNSVSWRSLLWPVGSIQAYIYYTNTLPVAGQKLSYSAVASFYIPGQGGSVTLSINKSYKYAVFASFYFSHSAGQHYKYVIDGNVSTPAGTVIRPTATVVDPPVASMGQDAIIRGLPVTSSMTPESAADAIQDQATTSAGLTATPSIDGEAVPEGSGWLYNAIQDVGEFIVDGIGGLFVPREGFWDDYVDNIQSLFDDRMGLLTYPLSVVADLFERVADLDDVEPVLRWNDVVWKGQVVIPGGSYNLNDILEEDSMETIYGIYRVVVSGIMVIALIHLFIKKLEEIETK